MSVAIIISKHAVPAEQYAAQELKKYLSIIYGIDAKMQDGISAHLDGSVIIVCHRDDHPNVAGTEWPVLSADGFYLKTICTDPDVLVVAGGSGRGMLFGVYELVQRWGVRFLLSGDVFPEHPEPFSVIGFDDRAEPAYPIRAMRPMANLPEGSAAWDLSDFTRFIDQMAKLKFNTFAFNLIESGPWLDYEFRGVKRPAGDIFYGYRFPIDDDFIGKELFGDQTEFYSPILAKARDEEERKQLGIGLIRAIISHCKSRDLQTLLQFPLLEPPKAFKHLFNEWASLPLPDPNNFANAHFIDMPAEELGVNPNCAAWMNVADPVVRELITVRLKSLINTYPEADFYHLWVSEHRAGLGDSHNIFRALDAKYHLSPDFDWEKTLEDYTSFPFDRERYQNQMKGDLLFLSALDAILNEGELLQQTVKPDAAIAIAGVMPQLAPIVTKMLPPHSVLTQFLDYGVHGPADYIDQQVALLVTGVPATMEIGIQDDNNMYFPQANVESMERIIKATAHAGMQGYSIALWQVRQSDVSAAYLGEASWRPDTTASQFYRDFLPKLVGPEAAEDFEKAYRIIEVADRQVRKGPLYGGAFVLTDALVRTFIHHGVNRDAIQRIRPQFQAAFDCFRAARPKASPSGLPYVDFWLKRTQFAVEWLDMSVACADVGKILGDGVKLGPALTPAQQQAVCADLDGLIHRLRSLLELIAGDAKHLGDLGQIANINQIFGTYLRKLRATHNVHVLEVATAVSYEN